MNKIGLLNLFSPLSDYIYYSNDEDILIGTKELLPIMSPAGIFFFALQSDKGRINLG